jgi:hypothetical protein
MSWSKKTVDIKIETTGRRADQRMKEVLMEFVSGPVTGLVAIYEDGSTYDDGGVKRRKQTTVPIVGYLKDDKGDLAAAVVGDGGLVVPAARLNGFCGTRWQQKTVDAALSSTLKGGGSLFESVFGGKW